MGKNIYRHMNPVRTHKQIVVDVGSRNMCKRGIGSYRYLVTGDTEAAISDKWTYIGVDMTRGLNVDVVMGGLYSMPFRDNSADTVISGQCFEHVPNPFRLMAEIARICKPGGLVMVVAPFRCNEHRYPVDCWRYLPDGWKALFEESGLDCEKAYFWANDCWGIARKPGGTKEP